MSKHTSTTYVCGTDAGTLCEGLTYAEAKSRAADAAERLGLRVEIWDARDPEATTETFSAR